jgi:hypothetical protein
MMKLWRRLQTYYASTKIYSQPRFSEMKGIVGELGEMKIPLKPYAKLVRQRPYRLNPKYKEKVKVEIDRMLEAESLNQWWN